jgi:hypothetical protein
MEKLHFKIRKVGGLLEDSSIPELRPQYGNKDNKESIKEEQGKIITQNEVELKKYLYDNYLPETIIDSELLTFWDKVINKDTLVNNKLKQIRAKRLQELAQIIYENKITNRAMLAIDREIYNNFYHNNNNNYSYNTNQNNYSNSRNNYDSSINKQENNDLNDNDEQEDGSDYYCDDDNNTNNKDWD